MAASAHLEIHRTRNREHLHHYVASYGDKKENYRLYLKGKTKQMLQMHIDIYIFKMKCSSFAQTILFVGTAH